MSELREVLELPYWRLPHARVVVAALEASGKSLRRFALEHGVNAGRLKRWRRRVHAGTAAAAGGSQEPDTGAIELVPVTVTLPEPRDLPSRGLFAPPATLDVVVGPATVRVPQAFDEEHLRRVVTVLASC